MRPQLIIDCGSRVLSALLLTADGQLVPVSQEIRQVATRHVSADVLYEPRVTQDPDFIWEDALETLARAGAHDFFRRARRIGLRRPWDVQAPADALQLTSPLAVLSSGPALADRVAGKALSGVGLALLDALLDPVFTFVSDRQLAAADVDPVVILPAQTGRHARLVLEKLFRRRGFRPLTIVRRELAAAMAFVEQAPPCRCVVIDASDDDLHLHRVEMDGHAAERHFRTAASTTLRGLGWGHWAARVAAALQVTPSAAFDRSLTSLLTGSPESLDLRLTHGTLQSVLDDAWVDRERAGLLPRIQEALATIDAADLWIVFAGEIFTIDAVRRLFGGTPAVNAPMLDHGVRSVALATRWLRGGESRRLVLDPGGSLRVNSFHGEAVELLSRAQLPAPGEACHFDSDFRFGGETAGKPFLVQLLWGGDRVPEGNATLCAIPMELGRDRGDELRLTVHLRRSESGRRLYGSVEARLPRDVVAARAQFAEELEVSR